MRLGGQRPELRRPEREGRGADKGSTPRAEQAARLGERRIVGGPGVAEVGPEVVAEPFADRDRRGHRDRCRHAPVFDPVGSCRHTRGDQRAKRNKSEFELHNVHPLSVREATPDARTSSPSVVCRCRRAGRRGAETRSTGATILGGPSTGDPPIRHATVNRKGPAQGAMPRPISSHGHRAAEGAGPYSVCAGPPIEGPACVAASGCPTAGRREFRAP